VDVVRDAARVLLLDDADRVLLLRFADLRTGARVWVTPGGAVEPGETSERAALRELEEETGLRDIELGPLVGDHRNHFVWNGRSYRQHDRYFVARAARAPVLSAPGLEFGELLVAARWWDAVELAARAEPYAPFDLADRVAVASALWPRRDG
jgi:8-oxo-dGTP pyrophosphatase MutT (NUDIX family)